GYAAVLIGGPASTSIAVASHGDAGVDSGAVLRDLLARHGGKGGGRPELAQGGGLTGPPADVLQSARELLTRSRA
ncbi:MAG TPA: DHHA1 domain-containing protein, partial [Vicinamibacterales bacterium]